MKKIIKKIVTSTFILSVFTVSFGQKIDTKSKKILDDVTQNYKSKDNTYFKFTFGSGTNGQVSKIETGIYYASGDKYKLKIMETEQIFDGNKIYNINTEDMEVTVAKPNSTEAMFSPINYLTTYRNDYDVTYMGKRKVNGVNTEYVKLTPIRDNGLKHIFLHINSSKNQMVKLEQHGNNKDVSVIAIKEYKENQKLNPNMFQFNKSNYKDYLITEL